MGSTSIYQRMKISIRKSKEFLSHDIDAELSNDYFTSLKIFINIGSLHGFVPFKIRNSSGDSCVLQSSIYRKVSIHNIYIYLSINLKNFHNHKLLCACVRRLFVCYWFS